VSEPHFVRFDSGLCFEWYWSESLLLLVSLEIQCVFLDTPSPLGCHLITKGYGQVLMVFTSVKDRDICVFVLSNYIASMALMSIF